MNAADNSAESGAGSAPRWLVAGAGSFGTAITHILGMHDLDVTLAARRPDQIDAMRTTWTNEAFFPGKRLPEDVSLMTIDEAVGLTWDVIVLAVPTVAVGDTVRLLAEQGDTFVCLAKGFDERGRRMSQVAGEFIDDDRFVALSGPNIAAELMDDLPAAAVLASTDVDRARTVQAAMSGYPFRLYTNTDLLGVELAGACKNVVAIAAGICQASQVGSNGLASVITRGMGEIARLGVAMGARIETFLGLAGMGDLFTTVDSEHSRNRRAGELIAAGVPAPEVPGRIGQTVEGLRTAPIVADLGRAYDVRMNVCAGIADIATGAKDLSEAMVELMSRPAGDEFPEGIMVARRP